MKIVTTEQMRELDRRTIQEHGTPGEILMDRAGEGVARAVARIAQASNWIYPRIVLVAGRGNNGGDALVAAGYLDSWGFSIRVLCACAFKDFKGDALRHFELLKQAEVTIWELPSEPEWKPYLEMPNESDLVVDGLLGTGTTGPARGAVAAAIQFINARSRDAVVVAIDVPSGLNADTGEATGQTVRADVTVTMGLPKRGLVQPAAREYVGSLEVVDIGIPAEYVDAIPGLEPVDLVDASDLKPLFPRRARASHKGDYGHVLLVGGARGYAGAITLAARAAVRSGAGLVTALVPRSIVPVVAGAALEVMVHGGEETESGSLSASAWAEWRKRIKEFDAVLIGPGLTRHDQSLALLKQLLQDVSAPLVLDADALSVLAGKPEMIRDAPGPSVITPHPGELARLIGRNVEEIQKDRIAFAQEAAALTGATVILKGAGSLVAVEGQPVYINMTGNPGMATGGSGDVLAGLLTGLLGQGLPPFPAAQAAVYLHGRAGDAVSWLGSQAGLAAGDLIDEIPRAFRDLVGR